MISIVVGVSLVPTIVESINTAKNTANAPTGMSGLLDVLVYVYIAVILLGESKRLCPSETSQIRGSLSLKGYGNPELNPTYVGKCVETRGFALAGVMG